MSRISLRAYNQEIEGHIDTGRIDEAIAHCLHILKYFPKHLDTYRQLGKAYLENQRYGDAADVFQRLLSSISDDFVANVGMSIIREDEGNLDAALWHMQRAYEVQPANGAIQEELRRLYAARDGYEPPRIRLTRGALARQYARGELHQQAIAELRAALAEEPERLDLQGILAAQYAKTGQEAEAVEICKAILRKLPFHWEANRLMADILSRSNREEEARTFLRHMHALDPYTAHMTPANPSTERVPEQAVTLEALDYSSQQGAAQDSAPAWAASLGVDIESFDQEQEEMPDWLKSEKEEESLEETPDWMESDSEEDVEDLKEAEIPGWMKEAGWGPLTGEAEEGPVDFEEQDELSEGEGPVVSGDLPDWLKAIAPEETERDWQNVFEEEPSSDAQASGQEEEAADIPGWALEASSSVESEEEEGIPDWLKGPADVEGEDAGEIPAWLTDLPESPHEERLEPESESLDVVRQNGEVAYEDDSIPEDEDTISDKLAGDEIPDWLRDEIGAPEEVEEPGMGVEIGKAISMLEGLDLEDEEEPGVVDTSFEYDLEGAGGEEDIPEWLQEAQQGDEEIEKEPGLPLEAGETPDMVILDEETAEEIEEPSMTEISTKAELEGEAEEIPTEAELSTLDMEADEAFAWLEGLAARQGAEEALLLSEEERTETPPEWVQRAAAEAEQEPEIEEETEGMDVEDWLQELEPTAVEDEEPWVYAEEAEAAEELPNWLLEDDVEYEEAEGEPGAQFEDIYGEEEEEEEPTLNIEELEAETRMEAKEEAGLEETIPPDATAEEGEWLELEEEPVLDEDTKPTRVASLEYLPGYDTAEETVTDEAVSEETPFTEEEEPESEAPDWFLEADETIEIRSLEEELPVESTPEAPTTHEVEAEGETDEGAIEAEIPDWLSEFEVQEEQAFEPDLPEEPAEVLDREPEMLDEEAADVPAWLHPETMEQETETLADEAEAELAEGLEAKDEEQTEQAPGAAGVASLDEDAEEAFAWLEGLAVKQGAEEALLLGAEERTDTAPEWVQRAAAEAESEDAGIPEETFEEPVEVRAPDLTRQFEQEQPVETVVEEVDDSLPSPTDEVVKEEAEEEPVFVEDAEIPGEPFEPTRPVAIPEEAEVPAESLEVTRRIPVAEEEEVPKEALEVTRPVSVSGEATGEDVPELPDWLTGLTTEEEEPEWAPGYDINEASLVELEMLPGIGFIMAQAIVSHRESYGPYKDLSDLLRVPGFTENMLEEVREKLYVLPEEAEAEQPPAPPWASTAPEEEVERPAEVMAARNPLLEGDLEQAVSAYQHLIQSRQHLELVERDLQEAVARYPTSFELWQALGDAYVRSDHLAEALEAYTQAEKLLR